MEIEFGAMAPNLKTQLAKINLKADFIEQYQKDVDAISRLNVRGLLTDSAALAARKRFMAKLVQTVRCGG